jgi:hypothetical protein
MTGNLLGGMAIIVVFGSVLVGVVIFTCAFLWLRTHHRRASVTPPSLFPYQYGEGVTSKVSELSKAASLKTVMPSSVQHTFPSRYY